MSWQAKTFQYVLQLRKWTNRNHTVEQFIADQRRLAKRAAFFCKVPRHCDHEMIRIGNIPCEWMIDRRARNSARVMLYFHGGAYVMGGVKTHYDLAAQLSEATGSRVLLVDYRNAPEHPFPAALNDAMACYRYLLEHQFQAKDIALAGDSAGANLTLACLLKIRDEGLPMAAAGVCFSPWADMTHSGESHITNQDNDTMITMGIIPQVAVIYAGKMALAHPLISPLFADLRGLPPLFINASSNELLRDDAIRLATKAREQGVVAELSIKENLPHAYPTMCRVLPEARESIRDVADFLKRNTRGFTKNS